MARGSPSGGGKFWYALTGKGFFAWTTHPNLVDVFWLPLMVTLHHRGLHRRDAEATVAKMWEAWKEEHLPWRLRARLDRAYETQRKLRREVSFLRQLHELNRPKEVP